MVADGLVEEARGLFPMRHLNALNTVGYKELFAHFEGECTLEFAIDKVKQHSRNYARKQLSWFRRDKEIHWVNLSREGLNVVREALSLLDS
jgi:tRNA dimethylallyltransferase